MYLVIIVCIFAAPVLAQWRGSNDGLWNSGCDDTCRAEYSDFTQRDDCKRYCRATQHKLFDTDNLYKCAVSDTRHADREMPESQASGCVLGFAIGGDEKKTTTCSSLCTELYKTKPGEYYDGKYGGSNGGYGGRNDVDLPFGDSRGDNWGGRNCGGYSCPVGYRLKRRADMIDCRGSCTYQVCCDSGSGRRLLSNIRDLLETKEEKAARKAQEKAEKDAKDAAEAKRKQDEKDAKEAAKKKAKEEKEAAKKKKKEDEEAAKKKKKEDEEAKDAAEKKRKQDEKDAKAAAEKAETDRKVAECLANGGLATDCTYEKFRPKKWWEVAIQVVDTIANTPTGPGRTAPLETRQMWDKDVAACQKGCRAGDSITTLFANCEVKSYNNYDTTHEYRAHRTGCFFQRGTNAGNKSSGRRRNLLSDAFWQMFD